MTRSAALVLLAISIGSVAVSQLLFKAALSGFATEQTTSWRELAGSMLLERSVWLAVLLVAVGVVGWYGAMIKLPLSFMLPIAGVIAPVVSILASVFLGEHLSPAKMSAIILIAIGVTWLGWLNA